MVGYSKEDLVDGKINWVKLTPAVYAQKDKLIVEQLLSSGSSAPIEKEYIRKDGSLVPIIIGGALLQGDTHQGVAYVLDITEQKKAQQNLALSEERFRLVTRATNDAVRDWNLLTDVVWWNEGFRNMFGYKPEEIELGPESWYSRIHADDLERVLQKIHQVMASGEEQWSDEYRFRRADGSYAYILDRTYILRNEPGKAVRMLGSMVDVTYMKEIQEALEQQAAELRQSNADLEQFAFISSHDLQEPLNTAASFAKLLEKKYKHVLDADGQEFINFIVTSTDRMKMLIRSLLNYSKINAVAKSYETANLSELARAAVDNLQARILQTGAQVIVENLPTLPVIAPQIVQLFQNLISNALKFKSELAPTVHISAKEQAEHVLFSIQDNGIGMDMKYTGKIFQVFQRLHSRDEYEGAGIGLATCKRIVERHYGTIWVESSPGKGSTFFFTLRK
jgi:two-component system CheB/CheR fusion protein